MEEILFWIIWCPVCAGQGDTFSVENGDFDGEHCPKCGKADYDLQATSVTPNSFSGLRLATLVTVNKRLAHRMDIVASRASIEESSEL